MTQQNDLLRQIGKILKFRQTTAIEHPACIHAAVLVLLLEEKPGLHVLFTQRTRGVPHHKGQVSFPGGAVDDADSSWEETALRETHEEIGLPMEKVEILGRIDDARTLSSNFVVHPFVGRMVRPFTYRLNPQEVERIITVPLQVFHPENTAARRSVVQWEGVTYETPAYEYKNHVIWGATARIIDNLLGIIAEELPLSGRVR
jgi:8-oxo-dGTP pyrophosphatase MutT (NUDIX family)